MLNLMKADMRNIKLWEYIILLPSLILLSFLASPNFIHPYYMWIFYLTAALMTISIDHKKQEKVLPFIISLPVTRKEYIGAKYLLALSWFFLSTIIMTFIAFFFDRTMGFFTFELWITTFLLILFFIAILLLFGLFYKPAGIILFVTLIIFIITTRETMDISAIHFHPSLLISILLFPLSYYLSTRVFGRKDLS